MLLFFFWFVYLLFYLPFYKRMFCGTLAAALVSSDIFPQMT